MEDAELKKMWEEYDKRIGEARILNLQSWVLNLQSFEYLQTTKAKSKLNALGRLKIRAIALGFVWVFVLLFLVVHTLHFKYIFFAVSVGMIALITLIGIIGYIRHVVLIREIDNSDSVTEVQKKIAQLQSSTLRVVRIMFLQTPFYFSFFFTPDQVLHDPKFRMISFPIFLASTLLTIWLYRNISYKNERKKWFRVFFSSSEWTSVIKAMKFMDEIEAFKKEAAVEA